MSLSTTSLPPAAEALGSLPKEWSGYDPANLVCTRRKTWEVKANWKLWYENYNDSLHVPFVHPGSLAKQKVKSRQRASHVETDGAYIAHFTVHGGSRGTARGRPGHGPAALPETLRPLYGGHLLPMPAARHPVRLHGRLRLGVRALPERARPHDAGCRLALLQGADASGPTSQRRPPTTTAGVDAIVPEDNEAVERQQEGLCLPVGLSGKFTHMETLCHAFDNWVLDQMVDG